MNRATATAPHRPVAGMALRLLAAALLSAMFAAAKLAADEGARLVELLFWRQAAALPVIGSIALAGGGGLGALATDRPRAHGRRMIVGLCAMACNFGAMLLLPIEEATVIGLVVPILSVVLANRLLREPTRPMLWLAVALGFGGVLLVAAPSARMVGGLGLAIACAGAGLTAWVSILIRDLGRTEGAPVTVFWFSQGSMVPLGLLMLAFGHWPTMDAAPYVGLTAGLGVAAQLALTGALRLAPVSLVLPMDNSALIWSALLGAWLFGTTPAPTTWAGGVLIAVGICLVAWRVRPPRTAASSTAGAHRAAGGPAPPAASGR